MSLTSRLGGVLLKLRPAVTHRVAVERSLAVPMRDGVTLVTDRYVPAGPPAPIVLIRTPYGRGGIVGLSARLIAERGYQVVLTSCRGTYGSGGVFQPFRDEEADGLDTLKWLTEQPWFTGAVATYGPSYMGLTQWAVAGEAPDWLKAMVIAVSATDVRRSVIYPNEVLALETTLGWAVAQQKPVEGIVSLLRETRRLAKAVPRATAVLPLRDADSAILGDGRHVPFFQDWLAHPEPGDGWWAPTDHSAKRADLRAAMHMTSGWYDVFLPAQLEDFRVLRAAGKDVCITIGPWAHAGGLEGASIQLNGALDWFAEHLRGEEGRRSGRRVRAFLMGSRRWIELDEWPPAPDLSDWYLQAGGGLERSPAEPSEPDRYRYDPADPTPSCGGPALSPSTSGPRDQRDREGRADVLTYTSDVLQRPVTVLGPALAELHVASDAVSVDFVVTLCDVDPKGRSINVSTGLRRVDGAALAGGGCVEVSMWPTGHEFLPGHRIRVQVASAAHPMWARNLGLGEPPATAEAMRASEQRVYHDPERPSRIRLPLFG